LVAQFLEDLLADAVHTADADGRDGAGAEQAIAEPLAYTELVLEVFGGEPPRLSPLRNLRYVATIKQYRASLLVWFSGLARDF
jgi:hypothetical protein